MLNIRQAYANNKGYTLIELILGIFIISILVTSMHSILLFTTNAMEKSDIDDLALYNGRYALDYIQNEIFNSDMIVSSSKFGDLDFVFPNNIGFVSMEKKISYHSNGRVKDVNYNFRTYYQSNDELIRIAYNTPNENLFDTRLFSGYNQVCEGVNYLSNNSMDIESNLINLYIDFSRGNKALAFQRTVKVGCPMK